MMSTSRSSKGFTLVELSLAIVFVALLAMAIMMTSMQIMKIYSKGTTIKSVDQVARDFSDQLTRDLRSAPASQVSSALVNNTGRLCIGPIAYLWNTTAALNGGGQKITYDDGTGVGPRAIRLMRINDPSHTFCGPLASSTYVVPPTSLPTEFLGNKTNDLAIYSLTATPFVSNPGPPVVPTQPLYSVNYTIGTNNDQGAVTNNSANAQCQPPTNASANFDFCTVNQFRLVVATSNQGGN